MIDEWNNTARDFPELNTQTTIHKLFEEEAEKSSVKVAVVYEDVQLTYRELNEKANQLAHYLRSICDIHPDDLVALCLDKSELMIVSILGVWKSGAAYVPIDPTYPDERIEFIMQDTKAKIVIVNKKHMKRFLSYDMIKIDVDSLSATVNGHKKDNMLPMCSSTNLAYVIYTSGTTGKPKGVMIEHSGVINLKAALTDLFLLRTRAESILSFSNYVFDHFVEQLTYALLNSQVLVILNDEMRVDKPRLYQYLNKNKVTYLSGTPSVLQEYDFEQLRYIIRIDAVGEDFSEITFNKIRSKFNGLIINGYGPTEISITSHKRLYYLGEKRINKSIGRQIANTSCYVLDKNFNQIPVGGIGELYIGGIGVARGYLNRPELTAERFLPNPFQTDEEKKQGKNARLYKTGDLVRWLLNGEIEYLGRNDLQVKIRGLRIELGEIEAVLSSYQGVKQSVVIATDAKTVDGEERIRKYLVGYYVSDYEIDESDVKLYMETKLPDYMIPNRLMRLEKIPVNISGKLDLRALPQVDFSKYNKNELVLPRNSLEARIIQIWSDLLHIPVENISIHDDFFRLGGDSILVIRLLLMLTKLLAVKLTVASLFDNKTIAKLASHIFNGADYTPEQNDHLSTMNTDHSNHPYYLLSFAQERLLFISEFEGADGTNAYNIPMYIEFSNNNVQRDLLYQSLLAILYRHEILRTLIHEDQLGVTSQHVLNEAEVHSLFKINEISVVNKEQLDAELIKLAKYVFNLRKELLIKVTFYEMKNEDGYDCTTLYMGILIHHICFDGWSQNIFWKELQIFYDYFKKQAKNSSVDVSSYLTLNLPVLPVQYKDFTAWQRKYLSGTRLSSLSEFWKNKLDGFEMLNLIPDCQIRPSKYDYSGDDIKFELKEQTTTGLKQLAKNLNVSLFSLLLSAYTLMLSNYTNQQDIVIGTPVANRNQPELENLIGFFVNMLVLRIKQDPNDYAIDYIKKVSNEVINAQIHQEMPFERLVKELQIENDASRQPIVQVVFLIDNQFQAEGWPTANSSTQPDNPIEMADYLPNDTNLKTAKYDITTSIDETDICLKGHFNFATKIFHRSTIENMVHNFIHILSRFLELKSTCKILDIDCIDDTQKNQIQQWNNTAREFPELNTQTTIHKLFEEEAEKSSVKVAVVYEDVQLTYRELNEKANQLAHYLRSICDIHPDDLVALCLEKSELMIVSILGVWKSGAAYVPIDPAYPDERIEFIMQDTKAKIVMANKKYMKRFLSYEMIKIDIDSITAVVNSHKKINMPPMCSSANLAYIIYTSGTTGKPKSVLVEHGSVVSFTNAVICRYFGKDNSETLPQAILLVSNYVFDMSIEQLALSILNSNKLIIISNEFTIDETFYAYLNENQLTYMSLTPNQLQQMDIRKLKYLQVITVAGEPLTEIVFKKIRKQYAGKLINAYGITETTVYNVVYIYENEMKYNNSMGSPLSNTKGFVLNKSMQMLPMRAVGELYLTGDCVTRGYLNRPEMTAERFLPNPFQTDEEKKQRKNGRLYKTGDLVRWRFDGELEYLCRNDLQVKIRGLRIELGEIEAVLSSYQGVKQSVVIATDAKTVDGEERIRKYLVGYYVSDNEIYESDLKEYMETKLPDYMIPNRLMQLEKIPVTTSGKLDVKALPDIDFSVGENNYCAPRNELEAKLCAIWSDLLVVEKVGITDDFFRLGGDSIGSLQVVSRVRQDIGLCISVKDIFAFKTIEKLYDNKLKVEIFHLSDSGEILNATELGNSSKEYPLLPIQEYLLKEKCLSNNYFNQCVMIRIAGFDENRFKDCLAKLVAHHDVFRIRFKKDAEGKYCSSYQMNLNSNEINLVRVATSPSTDMTLETKWRDYLRKTIDIENGPMYMVGYSYDHGDNNSARVWIFVHDLIVDWISCRIISEDLQRLYAGNDLSSNSCYKQWSFAVNGYVSSIGKNEVMYWEKLLSANVNIFNGVLVDKQQTDNDTCETEIILTAEMIKILFNDCNKIYNTQVEHLLLTGLSYTLRDEITNLNENYVMFECSGRNFVNNLDMGRSVGMFKIIYPVLLQLADDDMRTSIVNVKEHVQQVPNKGIGFGAIIGNENNQVPWVSFNYLGLFENEDSEDGNKDAWHLLDAFCENTMDENTKELIKINAFIINKEMRLNIKTKMGIKRTVRFGKAFQFHIENIIKHAQLINRSYLTRSDVNYVIKDDDYLNRIQSEKEVNAIFMANSLQQGLLYHALKQSNVDDAYIVQFVFQYRTAIDQKLFKLAWEHAQKRFSCLRLRFDWQEELIQIIDKNQPLNWRFIDLTAEQDVSNQESKIKQIQEEDRNERFKLDVGNLFRVYFIQQNSDLFALIFTFHHIILDGWSLPILFDYIHQDYLNLIDDEHSPTPISSSNSSSVHDESYENAQIYLQEHSQENIDYWENEINKIEERCDFTGLLKQESKNKVVLNQYDHVKQQKESKLLIGDNLYRNLKKSCRNNGLTLSSMLQFAWHKVLNVYGNSNQTVTGTTVSGRDLPIDNIETSVGLFINTLPLIVNHNVDNSIIDAIKNIQDKMNEMINRSTAPSKY
ncbi:unnamed protein product [Rotaria magnacalcarata]|uniref:Fatty acid synthase n=2 Tax=Rotaria magnacalcarata TaxID=392030 RepID=A0A816UDP9_9BILA|nr:unnamed protein product [Rotaria magnacalcarata]